ncbi:hypothetical protein KSS87_018324, partial [Heliosperma pusillum]
PLLTFIPNLSLSHLINPTIQQSKSFWLLIEGRILDDDCRIQLQLRQQSGSFWISDQSVFLDLCASRASHYAERFVVTLNPVHSIADVYLEDDLEERMSKSKRSHVHFCAEEFDDVGLFCHMDEEHRVELKNEVIISSSDP